MNIYYDPRTGQVMGVYTDIPKSPTFDAKGFLLAKVPDGIKVTRDMRVSVTNGIVTSIVDSVNPEQPAESPDALKQRALDVLHAEQILKRALDPACPQVIKDYAATLP